MSSYNFPSFRPQPPDVKFDNKDSSSESESGSQKGEKPMKYILVTGGVISGVGKGIITSSIGVILKSHGVAVSAIKIDPYLNIDAGTFSPYEHGEVFVLDDGGEVDLDLGNYERFLDCRLHRDNNITTGKIYELVMRKERRGDYLGKTVQVIPHITDAIMEWVERVAAVPVDNQNKRRPEVCIIELGGTTGDIEGRPFIEAFRQFQFRVGRENFMNVHVSLIVETGPTREHKSKPTQNSVATLRGEGIWPDIVVCRSSEPIGEQVRNKLKTFCDFVEIINVHNVSNIYQVPVLLQHQNVLNMIKQRLGLDVKVSPILKENVDPSLLSRDWYRWLQLANSCDIVSQTVTIALVGKYVELAHEAYTSVCKALTHASIACGRLLVIKWINSEHLEEQCRNEDPAKYHEAWKELTSASGVLVPGGFGVRGVEGKIAACRWARMKNVPFLGVCLGMQCAVVEYARNVCNIKGAHSTEFNQSLTPDQQLIIDMPEHCGGNLGGTMRLGKRTTAFLTRHSVLRKLYGRRVSDLGAVDERHRHRYEVNPTHICNLTKSGLRFVGLGVDEGDENDETLSSEENTSRSLTVTSASMMTRKNDSARMLFNLAQQAPKNEKNETDQTDGLLEKLTEICERVTINGANIRVEICELADHKYYVGVQYHPEYLSHPLQPSAPYLGLILAASDQLSSYLSGARVPSPARNFIDLDRTTSHVRLSSLLARQVLDHKVVGDKPLSAVPDAILSEVKKDSVS